MADEEILEPALDLEQAQIRAHSPKWRTFLEKIYKRIEAKEKEENHE